MTVRHLSTPADRAATYRAMAKSRHGFAVDILITGDHERYLRLLRDVDLLEERAREEERRADRINEQMRERARMVSATDRILELAERARKRETREGA